MSSFRYIVVDWRHEHADEPFRLWSEIDSAGWEKRKVEEFRNGRRSRADETGGTAGTRLGEAVIPSLDEIAADPQFSPREISQTEFERIWNEAKPS
jgi:hypothetical protein